MLLKRLKNNVLILAILMSLLPFIDTAHAATKTVLLAFDRNQLCCLMNHLKLEEMLTDTDGITKAIFHEQDREVTVVYDDSTIKIAGIIDRLVEITKVDKEIIFIPEKK